ncbi:hypothetical protein CRUP_028267 [Coryphaenoides rupestris]|nr:hypothetical protein CRUP_028267 [Coryphaenoides rupestris]
MALRGPGGELGEQVAEEPEDLDGDGDDGDIDDQDASSVSPAEEITLPGGPGGGGGGEDESDPLLLPWDRFSSWLHCMCVVGFDLELGQAVEVIYPHHSKLSEKEKTSICYLSFPDSNSGCLGDTQFCFRFRQGSNRNRLPYVTFFHSLLKILAPEYFDKLEPCLEAACNDIDRWPTPHPGRVLSLPIMGVVIKVRIPTCYDKPGTSQLVQSTQTDSQVSLVLPTIHEVDLFRCFHPVFFHIQMLWELVLLGEPLVVMAPSPAESSDTVLALVSDFRPYFTIHDSEFKEYTTKTQAPPSVILGVTNPFFAKTLQHWPHIIRIGDMKQAGEMAKQMKDLQLRTQEHTEVETVDLVLKLKDKLTQAEKTHLPVRPGTVSKLQAHIETIILGLPEDLQGILHKPSTP